MTEPSNSSKAPRLFTECDLAPGAVADLTPGQAHYLRNVLRQGDGALVRLFNGRDGEWLARTHDTGRKSATVEVQAQIRTQPPQERRVSLLFCPIRKDRLDFLIEKAVELGATDLYPVLTQRTEVRRLNAERLCAQIVEASEQCERLTLPRLHNLAPLEKTLSGWPRGSQILACVERLDVPPLRDFIPGDPAFLIGPEGGFTDAEREFLGRSIAVRCVSLGRDILRAETAALYVLSLARSL